MAEYLDAVDAWLRDKELADKTRASLGLSIGTDPDLEARLRQLSQQTGVPMESARANLDAVSRRAQFGEWDFDALARDYPSTARYLSDINNARIAHDDAANLVEWESLLTPLARGIRAFGAGATLDISAGAYGVLEGTLKAIAPLADPLAGTILPENPLRRVAAGIEEWRKGQQVAADYIAGDNSDLGFVAQSALSGVRSAGAMLPSLGASIVTGNPAFALSAAGVMSGGQATSKGLDAGLSPVQALSYGAQDAAVEILTEKLPVGVLLKNLKAGTPFLKMLGAQALAEVPTEMAATALQNFNEWANVTQGDFVDDYIKKLPEAEAQTIIATLTSTMLTAGLGKGIHAIANRAIKDGEVATYAEQDAQALARMTELAQASKVLQRDPETFQQFVAQASEDAPIKTVYIDANTLMQSGLADQLAADSAVVAAQLEDGAAQVGGQIAIPVDEFAARIAPQAYAQSLIDHLKTEPEGYTRAEAAQYMQSHAADLQAEVEKVLAAQEGDTAFKDSAEAVKATIRAQLDEAQRHTPDVNEALAAVPAAWYAVNAARLDTTPEELYQRYPLSVATEDLGGYQQRGKERKTRELRVVDLFGNGSRVQHFDDKRGLFYEAQKYPSGRIGWRAGEVIDGMDFWLSDKEFGSIEEAQAAIRGLRISNTIKQKNTEKYGAIPSLWSGEARRIAKAIIDAGIGVDRFSSSTQSKSKYVYLESGLKVRISDHALPASYDQADIDHRYGEGIKALVAKIRNADDEFAATSSSSNFVGTPDGGTQERQAVRADKSGSLAEPTQQFEAGGVGSITNGQPKRQPSADTLKQENRGAFDPNTLTIGLLKNADLSTFLHESAHFFLEAQFDIAAKLADEARVFGLDALKPGERELLADAEALLKWFGVPDLETWYGMDVDERRSYHEKFARGFESYLFEGKAPSIELQGLFQRFRAWMLDVYKSLKALNVELTDEVRGVMDRMIATTDQIQLAEQGRSMLPLFDSPQAAGMTPEEFAAYQALGTDATNDAIQDLQARGLRDMQWLRNKRGRVVKDLQRQAKDLRAEVRMEAVSEVMRQPVYQAWQFLTGKNPQPGDAAPEKSDPNIVDPGVDTLFTAIAKLGGLNKSQVTSEWSADPEDAPQSGVFGKPVWRAADGGLTIDAMVEALAQYGYLPLDENGKADVRDLEERFLAELAGDAQHSDFADYGRMNPETRIPDVEGAGRLSLPALRGMGLTDEQINLLKARRMTAAEGLHPDVVAELPGVEMSSGDELVRRLLNADPPHEVIEALTDRMMLERHGELSSPEAIERAADSAIHNDARAKFAATEANALAQAIGGKKMLAEAAKSYASTIVARLKVRNLRPSQYTGAATRAARNAERAQRAGDLPTAAAEKRNQAVQLYAAKAAYSAQDEVAAGIRYLKRFGSEASRKGLTPDYLEQIDDMLDRFDLRTGQSLKAIDKRTALKDWLASQAEAGIVPDLPPGVLDEANRKSYKDMTVEEFRGLLDSVRQIEHLGRLKRKLLTAKDQREYEAIRDEMVASINGNAGNRQADTRTPTTDLGRVAQSLKRFWAEHIKAAQWARIFDGGRDGGPVWEYVIRPANERGDMETRMRAEATLALAQIIEPVRKLGPMGGKGVYFSSVDRALNRESRLAIALNWGNDGNRQRLLDGEGWTPQQVVPVLQSLTSAEWQAVQAIWDHLEGYRPLIAEKERRVYGKEPDWVDASPVQITTADGQTLTLRGGYYPIKYDPAASQRAEEHTDAEAARRQLQGAYTSATTRRSFTKSRVEEVKGRPLLYTLAGLYSGVNEVIHDLAWHEWLIDANRLMRSHSIDAAIRTHYGPEAKQQLKAWIQDIAEGDKGVSGAGEALIGRIRQGVSAAGLGFNVMSAFIQPLGITQSFVRVGTPWVGRGLAKYLAHPVSLTREVVGKSEFMANRARTRFRELNELRNQVQDQSAFNEFMGRYAYWLMMRVQQAVDVPTWQGAYEKAIAEGNDDDRSISLADQGVIDAQGGGMLKDLSAIERGGPAMKLFTTFYAFMSTSFNLGVGRTMTEKSKAKLAADYLLLYSIPAVLTVALKDALQPGGEDDDEDLARKLITAQLEFLMGQMVVLREFSEVARIAGGEFSMGYQGPAGLRPIGDVVKLGQQAAQGEFDDAFRKAFINVLGDFTGLPAAQANKTITGAQAVAEGDAKGGEVLPALVFGFNRN